MSQCGHDGAKFASKAPRLSAFNCQGAVLQMDEARTFFNRKDSTGDSSEKTPAANLVFFDSTPDTKLTMRKNDKRYQVCQEMLETEENYLRILNLMINMFKKPLEAKLLQGDELLNRKEIAMLFSKLPAIIQVHLNICNSLRYLMNEWTEDSLVGKIWSDGALGLSKIYPPYVNNYDEALRTLEICQLKPKFAAFLKVLESKPECQKNSLRDMLIRPVQRIPSVLLLLQELLKRTNKGNRDIKWLKTAISQIKRMLDKTNESRRQSENYHRFFEVCNQIEDFPPELITSERDFIQSVEVIVLDAGGILKNFKRRVVAMFLFNDMFLFAKSRSGDIDLSCSTMSQSKFNFSLVPHRNSLSRHISFSSFRRERKPYKLISMPFFSDFRSLEVIKKYGVFIAKIRYEKGDELFIFQVTDDYKMEAGIEFFENFLKLQCSNPTRELSLEVFEVNEIEVKYSNQIEEWEMIKKALVTRADKNSYVSGLLLFPSTCDLRQLSIDVIVSGGHLIPSLNFQRVMNASKCEDVLTIEYEK